MVSPAARLLAFLLLLAAVFAGAYAAGAHVGAVTVAPGRTGSGGGAQMHMPGGAGPS